MTLTAHTGCLGTVPNTLESIKAGFVAGADIIEIDIRFLSDGTPVLSHDRVENSSAENYVTLEAAFEFIKNYKGRRVNLDVKEAKNADKIAKLAKKCGVKDYVFFTGINVGDVQFVKGLGVDYYLNLEKYTPLSRFSLYIKRLIAKCEKLGAVGINLNKKNCSQKLVKLFHENGLCVSVWTIRTLADIKKYAAMRPDNITCKNISQAVEQKESFA